MDGSVSVSADCAKQKLLEQLKFLCDARLRTWYLIVIHLLEGKSPTWISESLKVSRTTQFHSP